MGRARTGCRNVPGRARRQSAVARFRRGVRPLDRRGEPARRRRGGDRRHRRGWRGRVRSSFPGPLLSHGRGKIRRYAARKPWRPAANRSATVRGAAEADRRYRQPRAGDSARAAGVVPRRGTFYLAYATLRPVCFQSLLDGVQELERGAAVEDAVVDLTGEPEDVQLVGVGNDGHDEGVFEVDGHTDIYALSEDYAVPVPDRVEDRILFEALDDRLYYERQVGELYVFAFCEGGLLTLAQGGETAHVHLDHGPGVRGLALAR